MNAVSIVTRLLVLPLAAAVIASCRPANDSSGARTKAVAQSAPPAVPVRVAMVERRDVPVRIRTIGNVESLERVVIRPQVSGQLLAARFTEGEEVKRARELLEIDKRPFEAALAEAEANLARSRALADDAARALEQYQKAALGNAVSQRDLDQTRANANAARASVAVNEAAVQTARLNLEYCTIASPIEGRTGALLTKVGNIVEANKTDIVEVAQLDPIGVSFALREEDLPEVQRRQAEAPLEAHVAIPGRPADAPPVTGRLSLIDNKVDPATGTVRCRATFKNDTRALWPGQFVNVTLDISVQRSVLVVPAAAVQTGQSRSYAYIVGSDNKAASREVKVARFVDDMAVITEGLNEGDTVIIDGQLRVIPGSSVEVAPAPQGQAPTAGKVAETAGKGAGS